jgi:hypothetical protein
MIQAGFARRASETVRVVSALGGPAAVGLVQLVAAPFVAAVCRSGTPPSPPVSAGCWMFEVKRSAKEGDVRVTTAYNRMLGLPGAWVRDVAFGERAMIVTVALRREQPVCSGCGAGGLKIKDHRVKRWRHLDVGGVRCVIECKLRRLYCPGCGDLPELVEWARGALHARFRRSHGLAGAADEPDAGHPADADRLGDGREHPRTGRR